jgi:hypothetical protein
MATATKKKSASKKATTKKGASKKSAGKKGATKKRSSGRTSPQKAASKKTASKKGGTKKNKLGVKNSLVNNINAHKKRGDSKPKKKSTVSKEQYNKMEDNWGKDK